MIARWDPEDRTPRNDNTGSKQSQKQETARGTDGIATGSSRSQTRDPLASGSKC